MFCSAVHFIRYTAAQIHTFHVQFRTLASQKFSYNPLLSYTTKCRVLRARFTTRRLVKVSRVTRDSVNSCSQFRQQLSHSNVELHVFSAINSAPNCDVYSLVIATSPCFIAVGGKKREEEEEGGIAFPRHRQRDSTIWFVHFIVEEAWEKWDNVASSESAIFSRSTWGRSLVNRLGITRVRIMEALTGPDRILNRSIGTAILELSQRIS